MMGTIKVGAVVDWNNVYLAMVYICGLASALLFAWTFSGGAGSVSPPPNVTVSPANVPTVCGGAAVPRVLLLVVDALRADWALEGHMPWLAQVLNSGSGVVAYRAAAHTPTVTMPRVQALMTGWPGRFADVLNNVASPRCSVDNLIDRALAQVDILAMDSIEMELTTPSEWDIMIGHLLGLDHAGHAHGGNSALVQRKLIEMDDFVHRQNQTDSFVLLVCGDHGMTAGGSHGGASPLELSVPLVWLSPLFNASRNGRTSIGTARQVDVAATLAALTGVGVPRNSVGKMLPEVLQKWGFDEECLSRALGDNQQQLLSLYEGIVGDVPDDFQYPGNFTNSVVIGDLVTLLSDVLSNRAVELDHTLLSACLAAIFVCCSIVCVHNLQRMLLESSHDLSTFDVLLLVSSQMVPALYLGSSLVEEEHLVRYFVMNTTFAMVLLNIVGANLVRSRGTVVAWCLCVAVVNRTAMFHRRTGDKWQHLSDVADFLEKDCNSSLRTYVSIMASVLAVLLLTPMALRLKSRKCRILSVFMLIVSGVGCALHRLDERSQLQPALVYVSAVGQLCIHAFSLHGAIVCTATICIMLHRARFGTAPSLIALHTYAPLVEFTAGWLLSSEWSHADRLLLARHLMLSRSINTLAAVGACFLHRHHLFVWSVFAPKMLFECVHSTLAAFLIIPCFMQKRRA